MSSPMSPPLDGGMGLVHGGVAGRRGYCRTCRHVSDEVGGELVPQDLPGV
jgi:hypothetical protein